MRKDVTLSLAVVAVLGFGVIARSDEPTRPTASASADNPAVPAAGHSIHGEAFNDGPRQKAYLMPGQGKADFPVTTAKPEAQAFINQGVAQLHSFFYFEAERSFRQAAMIDPNCAMAYWGMAMANVNNSRRARGFLKDAQKRNKDLTRREQLYTDALDAFYKDGADGKAHRQGLLAGLETIVQEFPNDSNARTWLAMVTWQNSGQDGIGSRQAVDTVLETVEQVESMHPGVHHYRIHLWDGVKPTRAEKSASLYAKTALGIAHAWHMPGHTYTGLKRYADAAYQQEGSARVDHAYMARDRVMPFEIHNYAHNNQWLSTSLSHIGRMHDAIAVARNLVEQPRDPQKNGKNDGGSPQRSGRLRWVEALVRYELWDDLIAATTSGALDWSDVPIEQKEKVYSLGLAYAAKEDKAKLAEQVTALQKLIDDAKKNKNASTSTMETALAELEGHQKLLEGDVGTAFDRFAKATSMRQEALSRAHLKARNFGFAETNARKAVESHPNEVPPLANQVEILQLVGKPKEAQEAYRKLEPLARSADADAPIMQRLAAIVASWKSNGDWVAPAAEPATDDATAGRIDLNTVGPLCWAPFPAEPIALTDTDGKPWTLADHKGRNVLVLFYLGGKCAHCMQQLQEFGKQFDALKALNTDLVAISTDSLDATKALKSNADGIKFPMPLLPDTKLDVFKAYRSHDDFEAQPLHGTILIDAQGNIRFQRISADPFLEVEFIKAEAGRINKMKP
ncbi:MAG TPA: peroxiredoxin family protein [Isosphaeraceae bacterium]|jgi:peroxiredoxin|nr:peroxiredoxin family protein [Isosphaeraceae bacterium]